MPRIRTVKPEFWDSPSTAKASAVARLAFIGMWNWADDYGRGTANLKELEGFIFPNDDIAELSGGHARCFRDVVAEVSECFSVTFYEVENRPYYAITSWERHQRNERRAAQSRHPEPDGLVTPVTALTRENVQNSAALDADARYFRSNDAEHAAPSGTGTGEQGNRGTGKRVREVSRFDEFWSVYPRKVGKIAARKNWDRLLTKGVDQQEVINGAKAYAQSQLGADPTKVKHPQGWLSDGRWEDELETTPTRVNDGRPEGW